MRHKPKFSKINVVVFQEDNDLWIAQGVELDICAQASTMEELFDAFVATVSANLAVCAELGKEPFEGIEPAPEKYKQMFDSSNIEVGPKNKKKKKKARVLLRSKRERRSRQPRDTRSVRPVFGLFERQSSSTANHAAYI